MDRKSRIAILVIFGLLVGNLLRSPETNLVGHYEMELSSPLPESGEPELELRQHVEVDIFRQGNSLIVQFEIIQEAPYVRILDAGAEAIQEGDSLRFVFQDNWFNSGRGRFFKKDDKYVLAVEFLGSGDQAPVGLLGRDWEVEKKSDQVASR